MQPVRADTGHVEQFFGENDLFLGLYITLQVMAITEMSPGHQHTVTTLFECFDDESRVNPAGTHDPYGSQVGRILQPGYARQVGPGIGTPVTQKRCDLRLEITHVLILYLIVIS